MGREPYAGPVETCGGTFLQLIVIQLIILVHIAGLGDLLNGLECRARWAVTVLPREWSRGRIAWYSNGSRRALLVTDRSVGILLLHAVRPINNLLNDLTLISREREIIEALGHGGRWREILIWNGPCVTGTRRQRGKEPTGRWNAQLTEAVPRQV